VQPVSFDDIAVDYTASDLDLMAEADARAQRLLDKFGCFLARGLFSEAEFEPICRDLRRLIGLRWRLTAPSPDFSQGIGASGPRIGESRSAGMT
jgi:hypothetical protein